MEFTEVIKNRYSCRKFDGRAVDRNQLIKILEAGRVAPTAKNLQEQRIYVIESEEALSKIDKVTPCRFGAKTVLVIAYNVNNTFTYPGGKLNTGMEDATIVATHMILAAQNAGVDSCWVNYFNPDDLKAELGIPEEEQIMAIMDLGYGAEGARPSILHEQRKPLDETVVFICD